MVWITRSVILRMAFLITLILVVKETMANSDRCEKIFSLGASSSQIEFVYNNIYSRANPQIPGLIDSPLGRSQLFRNKRLAVDSDFPLFFPKLIVKNLKSGNDQEELSFPFKLMPGDKYASMNLEESISRRRSESFLKEIERVFTSENLPFYGGSYLNTKYTSKSGVISWIPIDKFRPSLRRSVGDFGLILRHLMGFSQESAEYVTETLLLMQSKMREGLRRYEVSDVELRWSNGDLEETFLDDDRFHQDWIIFPEMSMTAVVPLLGRGVEIAQVVNGNVAIEVGQERHLVLMNGEVLRRNPFLGRKGVSLKIRYDLKMDLHNLDFENRIMQLFFMGQSENKNNKI